MPPVCRIGDMDLIHCGPDTPFRAQGSPNVFINGLQVKRHMICAHPESLQANEVCHVCDRKFKFRGSLEKHLRNSHTTEKTIPCHLCKKGVGMFHSSYKNLKVIY